MQRSIILSTCLLVAFNTSWAANRYFKAPLGQAEWKLTTSRLECRMSQTIPKYGEAIFRQRNARKQEFLLKSWVPLMRSTSAKLYASPPAWRRIKIRSCYQR